MNDTPMTPEQKAEYDAFVDAHFKSLTEEDLAQYATEPTFPIEELLAKVRRYIEAKHGREINRE